MFDSDPRNPIGSFPMQTQGDEREEKKAGFSKESTIQTTEPKREWVFLDLRIGRGDGHRTKMHSLPLLD